MTKTMTEKQMIAREKAIFNLFKKITKKRATISRPILENISLKDDGSAVATDSHRLFKVESLHDNDCNSLINGQTREVCNMVYTGVGYPETDRLIPDPTNSIEINVKEFYGIVSMAAKEKSSTDEKTKCKVINLKFSKDTKQLTLKPGISSCFEYSFGSQKIELTDIDSDYEVNVSMKFLLEGLLMFKQAKVENISLGHTKNKVRPFLLQAENLTYMIAPVRVMN